MAGAEWCTGIMILERINLYGKKATLRPLAAYRNIKTLSPALREQLSYPSFISDEAFNLIGFIHCCDPKIQYVLDVYKFTKINSEQEKFKLKTFYNLLHSFSDNFADIIAP